jgi:mono/diheme cytochrome c family protein
MVWAVLALSGCHSQPTLTPEQAAGQHLYAVRCAHCHEENDLALKPPPPNLHHIGERGILPNGGAATDLAIQNVVLNGKNKMPGFAGRFSQEQMAALIAYLRTEMP